MKNLEFNLDNFCLKVSLYNHEKDELGRNENKPTCFVIGSHIYYPRTFSQQLKDKLKLIFLDTKGFATDNQNQRLEDCTLSKIVQDIEYIRKSLQLEKIILIGHSIHAFMALEYASMFPENVTHLVMIASSPTANLTTYKAADQYFEESVCPERKEVFEKSMQKFNQSKDKSFIARMLAFGPRLWFDYNFDASSLWEGVNLNSKAADKIWEDMFAKYNMEESLKNLKCRILIALGRYDYFNPPHLWEQYRSISNDITFRVFEKSSHTPQFEEPREFDNELLKWLAKKHDVRG